MINILLGILQLISIMIIVVYEYKQKSLAIFLWATLLLIFGMPHLLLIISGTSDYNSNVTIKASLFVLLFNIIYLMSKTILCRFFSRNNGVKKNKIKSVKNDLIKNNDRINKKMIILFFFLLLLSFFILIYYSKKYLGGISNSSWGQFRKINKEMGFRSLIRYGTLVFFGSAGIGLVYLKNNRKIMSLITLLIIVLYALITGNRITILPAITIGLILYLYVREKKLTLKRVIVLSLSGFLIVYLVYFLRLLRIYGGVFNLVRSHNFIELNSQVINMLLNGDGELGLRKAFYHFIYYDNKFENFNKGHTYIRLLLIAIPTSLIPNIKPPDFAISMGSAWSMNPYNTSYSMHPTLYGDCFANFWWFGVLLGVFWALFSYLLDKFIYRRNEIVKLMLMVLYSSVYVIIGRGSVYNGSFIGFIGTIIILIVNLISRIKLK